MLKPPCSGSSPAVLRHFFVVYGVQPAGDHQLYDVRRGSNASRAQSCNQYMGGVQVDV